MKTCIDCKTEKPLDEFYACKTHKQKVMCYCKKCFNQRCQKRWILRKIEAIKYKGGKCIDCSLELEKSHYAVFEFHHLDPKLKDYDWTKLKLHSWSKIISELDKCVLLCANCHRMRHTIYPIEL